MRVPAQEGATFTLRHSTPNAELDPVVKGVSKTLEFDRAAATDLLGVAGIGFRTQQVDVLSLASGMLGPIANQSARPFELPCTSTNIPRPSISTSRPPLLRDRTI